MTEPAVFVFDLDGTISDPIVGIHRSVNYALTSSGFDEVARSAVAKLVGPPLDEMFRTLAPGLDERQIASMISLYRERYSDVGYAENTIYDGVADSLNHLSKRGLRIGVCTSKRVDFAKRILKLFGVRELFSFVDGGDVGVSKAQQLKALMSAGAVRSDSVMIGDRAIDISAARANGLSSIGVLWGYGSESELIEAGAERILEHANELADIGPRP